MDRNGEMNSSCSYSIRQEIQRFESVHPSIYAIYDLIELIPDALLAQQIREHVVCIEDSFVNSQEWTLSRSVPDIRLGIVGSLSSGKSALVHRYLTGSYMQEESPEGGRFKKEILIEGQSYLLLIRDEGGPPELQFTSWVDAVIFVFSLENETSFNAIYNYYAKMSQFRHMQDIPLILVGTQDSICENHPRVIDESRARKLASDLKRCSYYETCASYGLNVERVFQDACTKCVTSRHSRPSTPNHFRPYSTNYVPSPTNGYSNHPAPPSPSSYSSPHGRSNPVHTISICSSNTDEFKSRYSSSLTNNSSSGSEGKFIIPSTPNFGCENKENKELPTPSSTPTNSRKNRRRSNLFTPSKKTDVISIDKNSVGSGRSIPIRQGILYKKSNKSFSKDWKKKYVTLCDDGRMTYHPSLHDYMNNIHGKEISLQYVTVKVPGQKPRGSRTIPSSILPISADSNNFKYGPSGVAVNPKEKVMLTGYEILKEPSGGEEGEIEKLEKSSVSNSSCTINNNNETPNVKKRHRRMKSSGPKNTTEVSEDGEMFEFHIVSLDNKQWYFEASSGEERDEWVESIEQQILNSLQGNESSKSSKNPNSLVDIQTIKTIKSAIPGNSKCVDCDSPNPVWASINLGVLICIECSGVHRKLGSHISRVRSLDLDEWPPSHLAVMISLGNNLANLNWEAHLRIRKPEASSSQEDKENFIMAKYNRKEYLAPMTSSSPFLSLVESICRSDMKGVSLALAHVSEEDINSPISARDNRTPLHLACSLGNLAIVQLLLWSNANVKSIDHEGRTCISYARNSNSSQELVDLLVSNGAPDIISNGTLPRRKPPTSIHKSDVFDKITSSVL